jgi:lipocalin
LKWTRTDNRQEEMLNQSSFNMERYTKGPWYEISRIPGDYEPVDYGRGKAEYRVDPDTPSVIRITNTAYSKLHPERIISIAHGQARVLSSAYVN